MMIEKKFTPIPAIETSFLKHTPILLFLAKNILVWLEIRFF